jgi:uncharacterized protein YhaN
MASLVEQQLQSLLDGFDALRLEYQRVYSRCATLEANMASARSQVSAAHLSLLFPPPSSSYVMNNVALDLQLFAALTDNQPLACS